MYNIYIRQTNTGNKMDKRLKLFELVRREGKVLFNNSHNVHTPQKLTDAVLSNLNLDNKDILVLLNVEFIISLVVVYNVDPSRITFFSDHENKSKLAQRFGVKYIKGEPDMKFDIVVGNPPYQDPTNDKKMLWNAFMDKSVDLLNPDGHLAMVTPATWLRATTNIHNSYRAFEELEVEKAVVYAKDDTPFNVGSTISYHITKNTKRKPNTPVYTPVYYAEWSKGTETLIRKVDIATEKIWPGSLTETNLNIHDKLQKFQKIVFTKSCEFHNQKLKKKGLVSNVQSDAYPYVHHVSAGITRYTSTKFSKHAEWKVMVPLTSTINKAVVDNNCGHGEDMLTLYVADNATANNIKHLFETDVYKFIGKMYKSGRNQMLQNIFPLVAFNKKWTSDELFDLFDFTEKEREYARNYR